MSSQPIRYRCPHCGGTAVKRGEDIVCEGYVHCSFMGTEDDFEWINPDGNVFPVKEDPLKDPPEELVERFSQKRGAPIKSPGVDLFLREIDKVCKKHGYCIEHEDTQGAFIIEKLSKDHDTGWLMDASIGTTISI